MLLIDDPVDVFVSTQEQIPAARVAQGTVVRPCEHAGTSTLAVQAEQRKVGKKMQILFFEKVVDNVVDMLLCDDRCR